MRILVASVLALTVACTPSATASPSASPSPTFVVRASLEPSPPPAPSPTPTPIPTPVAPPVFAGDGLTTYAIGSLTGDIAFVVRPTAGKGAQPSYRELWAVPLDGRPPRLAAQYRVEFDSRMRDTNSIAQALSPDGRRIVLSVGMGPIDPAYQLMILELASGAVTPLFPGGPRSHDRSPAWSPDGKLIAFSRRAFPTIAIDGEVWVAGADGKNARRLWAAPQGAGTGVYGWTADSRRIGFDPVGWEYSGYALIDLAGRVTDTLGERSANSRSAASWRAGPPSFAGTFGDAPRPQRFDLLVGDSPSAARTIASVPVTQNNSVTGLADPRWDPAGGDVLLYRLTGVDSTTVVRDLVTGAITMMGGRVSLAEWSANGDLVVTVEQHPATGADAVYVFERSGKIVHDALRLPQSDLSRTEIYRITDLVVRAY